MVIMMCLRWWYTAGWQWVMRRMVLDSATWAAETFSMKDLAATLFAPFRQTFSGSVRGSIDMQLRGAIDNLISRVIGFLVRIVLLTCGAAVCVLAFVGGLIVLLAWAFIPLLPLVAIILTVMGWKL